MDFLKTIDRGKQRNVAYIVLGLLAASQVYFIKPILNKIMTFTIWGNFDVATVLGTIGLISVWLIYKRRL